MSRAHLLLAAHCHQPAGNFGFVLEENTARAYEPLVAALERHPGVRMSLHISGLLLEWLDEKHPKLVDRLGALARRSQIEFWTGGYFEPILAAIPEADAVGQIRMLSARLRERFGVPTPAGLWLTERVYEPHLPALLARAGGIRYTAVDDSQLRAAGVSDEAMRGPIRTEHLGHPLVLFPISKRLRYLVPFRPVDEVLALLREVSESGEGAAAILADDGEKFGAWPDTFEWVHTKGWLDQFFGAIEQAASWIESSTYTDYLDAHPPAASAHPGTGSYDEMEAWALPVARQSGLEAAKARLGTAGAGFVRGTTWKGFLDRYPEANRMHKRMVAVSRRVWSVPGRTRPDAVEPEGDAGSPFARDLWRAQCNDAYWHGVFGGLYLNALRFSVWRDLIRAETSLLGRDRPRMLARADEDLDGRDEVRFAHGPVSATAAPGVCGGLVSLEWIPGEINVADAVTRQREAYHDKLAHADDAEAKGAASIHDRIRAKEPGLAARLVVDRWVRGCGVPFLVDATASREDFSRGEGTRGPLRPDTDATIRLGSGAEACGCSWVAGGLDVVWRLERVSADRARLLATYRAAATFSPSEGERLAVEWNLSLLAPDAGDRYYVLGDGRPAPAQLASEGEERGVSRCGIVDEWTGTRAEFHFSTPADWWRFPIETVSLSEGGFERVYQHSALVFLFPTARLQEGVTIALELSRP